MIEQTTTTIFSSQLTENSCAVTVRTTEDEAFRVPNMDLDAVHTTLQPLKDKPLQGLSLVLVTRRAAMVSIPTRFVKSVWIGDELIWSDD